MTKASDLKKNMIVRIEDVLYVIQDLSSQSPSARGASTLYKAKLYNVVTGQKINRSYKGDDQLEIADTQKINVQFSYMDGQDYVFMNLDNYSQYSLSSDELGDVHRFLKEGMDNIIALLVDDQMITIELPTQIELTVGDTQPSIKGATASKSFKPATLDNGMEINVPDYISVGDRVRINTQTGKFMSRA